MRALLAIALLATTQAHASTIYLCKSYNGATFWSSAACSTHNALIDRIETVGNVPWPQQVEQAEQAKRARESNTTLSAINTAQQRAQRCGQLASEKREIESRYTNWQWQPPEVINPDQQRQRGIDAEGRALGCPTQ